MQGKYIEFFFKCGIGDINSMIYEKYSKLYFA